MSSGSKRAEAVQGLHELFAEIDAVNPGGSALVADGIAYLQSKGFDSDRGALSDFLAPEGASTEFRRQAQVLASTLPASGRITPNRRDALRRLLMGAQGLALGAVGGFLGDRLSGWTDEPDAFDEALIRHLLRLHSDRPALRALEETCVAGGRWKEADLVGLLSASGEGFDEAFKANERLREIIGGARLSRFSQVYLKVVFCTQHRYLGLWRQSAALFEEVDWSDCYDRDLNVLLLNHRYSFHNRSEDASAVRARSFSLENVSFDDAAARRLGLTLDSLSQEAIKEARQISIECVALKGIFQANRFMAASDENEALQVLDSIDDFRRGVFDSVVKSEAEAGRGWLAIRLYGEAVWNYSRVAPFAFGRGWDRAVQRCIASFYDVEACSSSAERGLQVAFHEMERGQLRSPLWIQIALLRSMYEQIARGSGEQLLDRLLPVTSRHKIRQHTSLQRVLDAMSVALGRDPVDINVTNTVAACENKALLDCVGMMKSRCC